jgi:hypothetical protein
VEVRGGSRRPDRVVALGRVFLCFRNGTARTQTIDFGRAKSELPENFLVVFSNLRGALGGHLGDAMHLKRAADVDVSLPPAPLSGTMMSFAWSWGSLITSCGPRTAPNVT